MEKVMIAIGGIALWGFVYHSSLSWDWLRIL